MTINMQELKGKTDLELQDELLNLFRELFNLRMQKGSQDLNVAPKAHLFKKVRRDIARIKTILSERKKNN